MHKPTLAAVFSLCLSAGLSVSHSTARAQAVFAVVPAPGFASPLAGNYKGAAVWQQADGTLLKGTVYLSAGPILFGDGTPRGDFILQAFFIFGSQSAGTARAFSFGGKLAADGRGVIRRGGETVTILSETQALPELDPGKVAVLFSPGRGVASGGVLAEDGTQLTFRAVRPTATP